MTPFSHGYFNPSQLKALDAVLDSATDDQEVSARDRERLSEMLVALVQSGVTSDADLRRRLLKAGAGMMLDSGHFLKPRLRHVTRDDLLAFRERKGELPTSENRGPNVEHEAVRAP